MSKKLCMGLTLFLSVLFPVGAFSSGGNGSACSPTAIDWGSCTLAPVPFQSFVTNTINIPAGNYSSAYIAGQNNTEYILEGNISANGTAISITGNYVIINLNGYTITYNQVNPGEGVSVGGWNKNHISVRNGSIIQGAASSSGDVSGGGNNPVGTYSTLAGGSRPANNFHVANLYTYSHGHDVGGIWLTSNIALVEQSIIEDDYPIGSTTNRHQGIDAIALNKGSVVTGGIVRNNTIINARHRAIQPGYGSEVYGNKISVRGVDSNSYGVFGWQAEDVSVHDNSISMTGVSPVGVGFTADIGTPKNVTIYRNNISAKTTALNEEYSGSPDCFTETHSCGLTAIGIRVHGYGAARVGMENLNIYDNTILIETDSKYAGTYAPTGEPVWVDGKGKGMSIGVKGDEVAHVYRNNITVLDKDGTGEAYGVSFTVNESDSMFFYENTVKSNVTNIVFGDSYSYSRGYPLVYKNTLIKQDNFSTYATFANKASNWHDSTGRVVENTYSGGASVDSASLAASGPGIVDIYFDSVVDGEYYFTRRLHDNGGVASTLLVEDYAPAISLNYSVPSDVVPSVPVILPPSTLVIVGQ